MFKQTPPKKILVIITRRIGDVLLATPLIHTLKIAWPHAEVDVLVFENTRGILANHPDIHQVIAMPSDGSKLAKFKWQWHLWRKYDLAISALTSDRATIIAWISGKYRIGLLEDKPNQNWKKWLLNDWVMFDNVNTHTVSMVLKLASKLGLSTAPEVSAHWTMQDSQWVDGLLAGHQNQTYVVLHVYPKFAYKMWLSEAWVELVNWLNAQNFQVILTGSSDPEELRYIAQLIEKLPKNTLNLASKLNFAQMAYLLKNAKIYVGPDTVATHLAAAMGAPTVALFGPSNPVKWGPWPAGYTKENSPWKMVGATQKVNNVILLQGIQPKDFAPCVPCTFEGCERNINSRSRCLDELPASRVIAAINTLLS
ncbi:MAG: glycosyltransferase family 9 protein [Methylophilaceae bacterium]